MNRRRQPKQRLFRIQRSHIHGTGVFAATRIPRSTRIIEYVGEKVTMAEADRRSLRRQKVFMFTLNQRHEIDGNVPANVARYINHSCDHNCYSTITRGRIWIHASRTIHPGEELTYNYGYQLDDDYAEAPCRCGADNCIGYILERSAWPRFHQRYGKRRP
jgi:uncharacterized protein